MSNKMGSDLQDKVAVVTGGAAGIGAAAVRLFLDHGAAVVIADLQEEKGEALARELGARAFFQRTDVSDASSVEAAVAVAISTFGSLDIMFNNAGVSGAEGSPHFVGNDFSNFERVMAVDLLGPMLGARAAAKVMGAAGGGVILNTASIAGSYSGFGLPEYRAAKAGVIALTQSLALELGPLNIRVNSISPGPVLTDIVGMGMELSPEKRDAVLGAAMSSMREMQVLDRVCLPEDIAEAALFLASDRAKQITGIDLVVDSGASLGDRVNRQLQMGERIGAVLNTESAESP